MSLFLQLVRIQRVVPPVPGERFSEKVGQFFLSGTMLILVLRFRVCNSWIVSILASCGRLPAIVPDVVSRPRQLVFLTPIDSQLNDFLNEIHQIAIFEPSIVERIDSGSGPARQKDQLSRSADH